MITAEGYTRNNVKITEETMTKIESWEKECLTKNRYDSYELADRVALDREKETGFKLYSYRCTSCGFWHLTRQKQRKGSYKILKVV